MHVRKLTAVRVASHMTMSLCVCAAIAATLYASPVTGSTVRFGIEGAGAGELSEPIGIAVNQESGHVYIGDRNNQRVDEFAEEGSFLKAWGWGVADGHTEALQACSTTCFAGRIGEGGGQFFFPEGVAIDNDPLSGSVGDVYVLDTRNHRVQKFDQDGSFQLTFGRNVRIGGGDICQAEEACQAGEPGEAPGALEGRAGVIAVTAEGVVAVGDVDRLELFGSGGGFEREISLPGAGTVTGLAIDSAENFYVEGEGLTGVHKFDSTGSEVVGEPRDTTGAPGAIAVGPSDELYVVDASEGHHIFEYAASGEELASFDASSDISGNTAGIVFSSKQAGLYVLNPHEAHLATPPPPGPLAIPESELATEVTPVSAVLEGSFNSEGPTETHAFFEYGTSTSYGATTPIEPVSGGAFEDHHASASIASLAPGTEYHYRLVIANEKAETAFSPDATFVTQPPALINRVFAADVTSTSARLGADLDPLGTDTEYRFEYGTSTSYEAQIPMPDGDAGSQSGIKEVSLIVEHLKPGTRYHYRLVAHNSLGEVVGADQTFVTQGGAADGLLDERGWEMVSPPEKQGVSLEGIPGEGGLIQAAADGNAITYYSQSPIESDVEGNRSLADSQIFTTRSGDGWLSKDISVKHEKVTPLFPGNYSEYRMFSDDLKTGIIEPEGATPLVPAATERTAYKRMSDGSFVPFVTPTNVPPGTKFGGVEGLPGQFDGGVNFVTATPDEAFAVFVSPQALTSELATGLELSNVYEWHGGAFRLASILPNGKATSEEGLNAFVGMINNNVRGALSDDGARVVFTTNNGGQEQVYLRDLSREETVQVDVPEAGAAATEAASVFQLASSDGKRVFFLDSNRLTQDSTARPAKPDLYMCEVAITAGHLSCRLEDLTVTSPSEAADVQSAVIGSDSEGRYVYFVANGRLTGSEPTGGCLTTPTPGVTCNLYVRDVEARTTKLVAVLSGKDLSDWLAITGFDFGGTAARVSRDGRFLAFMSQQSLTGFDNHDARGGALDEEVYLYDREKNTLTCVSCERTNTLPVGVFDDGAYPGLLVDRPTLWKGEWLAGSIPGWTKIDGQHALYPSRILSNSGRLFFNSATALVPQDTNGREDVYEYEPSGVAGCHEEGGCVGLISSGQSGEESAFLDASSSGDDAFFITAAKLSPADRDGALDIYDARVCSVSSPCLTAPPEGHLGCASNPGCRTATGLSAEEPPPASESPSGGGNLTKPVTRTPVKLTRAQLLARSIRACNKLHGKKRATCIRRAKKRYGPLSGSNHHKRRKHR